MKSFLKKISFGGGLDAFTETVKRFPLSSFCCVLAFVLAITMLHDLDLLKEENAGRLFLSLVLGYLWFGVCQVYAESKDLNGIRHGVLVLAGYIPLLFLSFGAVDHLIRFVFIVPALFLLIMVAPYVFRKSNDESFWVFNRHVWFGVAVAFVASLLLAGGISAAIAAVKYLFDIKIEEEIFGDIFAFCGLVLGPVYALSFVPQKFDYKDEECHTPTQVGFIVNWILAPLVIVYMAILYAYFIKIGLTWDIPKGQLSYMIVGFIGAGLVTYLVSWPVHGQGSKALSLIVKYLFPAMVIPVVFQAVSIGMRIEQYGVTEKRYIVAAAAVWFSFVAVGFLMKKLQLKHIPLSLAVLLLLAAVGPWSARDVSMWSQVGRLENLLLDNGFFKDGALVQKEDISYEIRKEISDVADYVLRREKKFYGYENAHDFTQALGFSYLSKWDRKRNNNVRNDKFNYNFTRESNNELIDVRQVDFYVVDLFAVKSEHASVYAREKKKALYAEHEDNILTAVLKGKAKVTIDLTPTLRELIKREGVSKRYGLEPITVSGVDGKYEIRLRLLNLSGNVKDGEPILNGLSASVFVKKR